MESRPYPIVEHEVIALIDGSNGCYHRDMREQVDAGERYLAKLEPGGRLTLPPELQDRLGWHPGEPLILTFEADGTVRLTGGSSGKVVSSSPAGKDRAAALRATAGMWKDREDLPDQEQLRQEWDRKHDPKA
jgi:bifunctional DNA-binding transcriptional regulator/antitoxin component of YhaV-PrlF toxin-antitoxin module